MDEIQGLNEKSDQQREKMKLESKSSKALDDATSLILTFGNIKVYDKNVIAGIIKKVVVHAVDRVEVVWACEDEYGL